MLVFTVFWVLRQNSINTYSSNAFWIFWAPYLRACIEYPHLFTSYQLAYEPKRNLLKKYPGRMLVFPLFVVALAVYCAFKGPNYELILTACLHATLFGFGWHRMRQVWGTMLIYAKYDGLTLDRRQRNATYAFLFSMWVLGYFTLMRTETSFNFFGAKALPFTIPDGFISLASAALIISWMYFMFEMLIKTAYVLGRLPSLNLMIPMMAMFFWWVALYMEPAFFFFLAPAFHGLQYLNVAWAADGQTWRRRGLIFALFVFLGLGLESMPFKEMIAVAYLGLSLHHYLLDSIIWKSDGVAWQKLVSAN